jgi:hypothetical protein
VHVQRNKIAEVQFDNSRYVYKDALTSEVIKPAESIVDGGMSDLMMVTLRRNQARAHETGPCGHQHAGIRGANCGGCSRQCLALKSGNHASHERHMTLVSQQTWQCSSLFNTRRLVRVRVRSCRPSISICVSHTDRAAYASHTCGLSRAFATRVLTVVLTLQVIIKGDSLGVLDDCACKCSAFSCLQSECLPCRCPFSTVPRSGSAIFSGKSFLTSNRSRSKR